jgi:hypothetical protein
MPAESRMMKALPFTPSIDDVLLAMKESGCLA